VDKRFIKGPESACYWGGREADDLVSDVLAEGSRFRALVVVEPEDGVQSAPMVARRPAAQRFTLRYEWLEERQS
jgi:hypothetical protein